jgi:hypothetical protein
MEAPWRLCADGFGGRVVGFDSATTYGWWRLTKFAPFHLSRASARGFSANFVKMCKQTFPCERCSGSLTGGHIWTVKVDPSGFTRDRV